MSGAAVRPVAGCPVVVLLGDHAATLDLVRRGWEPGPLDDEAQRLDLTPALDWHARRRRVLDPVAALNTWDLAGDVSRSVGRPWGDRGRVADACFDKLTYANVPWLIGETAYRPRWSVVEERYLRRRLGSALTLFAEQFRRVQR